jgi:hypothetical protein
MVLAEGAGHRRGLDRRNWVVPRSLLSRQRRRRRHCRQETNGLRICFLDWQPVDWPRPTAAQESWHLLAADVDPPMMNRAVHTGPPNSCTPRAGRSSSATGALKEVAGQPVLFASCCNVSPRVLLGTALAGSADYATRTR